MRNLKIITSLLRITFLTFLVFGLAGCTPAATDNPDVTPIPPTPEVTSTPTVPPATLVLIDPAGLAGEQVDSLLTEFAGSNSLQLEKWTSLDGDFTAAKIVVVYDNSESLVNIAGTTPQTQFIVISQTALSPSANISVIQTEPVDMAFMAGYLTAMTSEDWRAGGMLVDDSNLGIADAFTNGGQYMCGQCTPIYPPMLYFPVAEILSSQSDAAAWTAQSATISEAAANSVFIDRAGDMSEVLSLFPDAKLFTNNLASANSAAYAAILGADALPGLQQLLPQALAGQGGQTVNSTVSLVKINNEEAVSSAKQTNFNKVSQDLAADLINPLSVP